MQPFALNYRQNFTGIRTVAISVGLNPMQTAVAFDEDVANSVVHKVYCWNNTLSKPDQEFAFDNPVLSVRLHGSYLIVVLETSLCFYDISKSEMLLDQETSENSTGCGDISIRRNVPKLAICGLLSGEVQILSLDSDTRPIFLDAHRHAITIIRFSPDGSLLATATIQGTLIRVFCAFGGALRGIFRRGAQSSQIVAVAICPKSARLVVVSEKGTIHAFSLTNRVTDPDRAPRASSKVKIESGNIFDVRFSSDTKFIVASGSGTCYFFTFTAMEISLTQTRRIELPIGYFRAENVEHP
jgi:WD40 repeat protein